jgi:hypothetical protein
MPNRSDSANGGVVSVDGRKTRREVLTVFGSAGALTVGNVGLVDASTDRVLTAIERHKAAWTAVGALCPAIDEVAMARLGNEVAQADWDAYERATAIAEQALDELLATPPGTIESMRAAITYILGFDDGDLSDLARPFLMTLLKSPTLAM